VNLFGDPDRRIIGAVSLVVMAACLVVGLGGLRFDWPRVISAAAFVVFGVGMSGTYYARRVETRWIFWACALGVMLALLILTT
jgi:uncharacterized membrane protein AbrB (regulator of aidB expression)